MDASPTRIAEWTSQHREDALDAIRMFLGVALFVRGVMLIRDPTPFAEYAVDAEWVATAAVGHYVIPAHFVGGAMLAVGLATRLSALVQIPALFGAVFLIHLREGLMTSSQSLELSGLVLFLLVTFGVVGAGRLSLDHYVFGRPARRARTRSTDRPITV